MQLDNLVSLLSTLAAAAVVVYASWRRGTTNVWKEEAEAQKARADRLEDDLDEIKERLARIEKENARLIELLTALDPERLRALRI
jgi:predicted nuclease with TOPRIM domain